MRLDHLLSREQAKAEMPELNRRSIGRKNLTGREGETVRRKSDIDRELNSQREGQRGNDSVTGTSLKRVPEWKPGKLPANEIVLYRLQGSVNPHLDNCTAKAKEIHEKASCRLKQSERKNAKRKLVKQKTNVNERSGIAEKTSNAFRFCIVFKVREVAP